MPAAERTDLRPTQAIALGLRLEEQLRAEEAASGKRAARTRIAYQIRQLPPYAEEERARLRAQMPPSSGSIIERAAEACGLHESCYQRAKAVVLAVRNDPERFGDLLAVMDGVSIAGAYLELRRRQKGRRGRSDVHRGAPRPRPNLEMARGVETLSGLVSGFALIERSELDRSKVSEWADALSHSASTLRDMARILRGINAEA